MADERIISFRPRPGYDLIFRPWFIHPRTKKVVYPKRGRVFPMWVKNRNQLELALRLAKHGRN